MHAAQQGPGWFEPRAIGRRIQRARGDLSQRELGAALGYLQPHISRYERGEVPGSYRFLAGLAAFFGADLNWLLTGKAARSREAVERRSARPQRIARGVVEDRATSGEMPAADWLREALRAYVQEVAQEARARPVRESTPEIPEALRELIPDSWDRLQVELPLLVAPLLKEREESLRALAELEPFAGSPLLAVLPPLAELPPLSDLAPPERDEVHRAKAGIADSGVGFRPVQLLDELRRAAGDADLGEAVHLLVRAARSAEAEPPMRRGIDRSRFLLLWAWALAEMLAADRPAFAASAARVLYLLARVTRKSGLLAEAQVLYERALAEADSAGDTDTEARCHAGLGNLHFERGDFDRARSEYVALLEEALRRGSPALLYRAYLDLSAYYHEGEHAYEKAAGYARAGLEIAREANDLEHVGRFLNELGLNALEQGDHASAEGNFAEVRKLGARRKSPLLSALGALNLGELRLRAGDLDAAARLLGEARSTADDAGLEWVGIQAEILRARADHLRGQSGRALERLEEIEGRCEAKGLSYERDRARAFQRELRRAVLGRLAEAS